MAYRHKAWTFGDPKAITLEFDVEALLGYLDDHVAGQIDYATSRALNAVARDCTTDLQRRLPASFQIRSRWVEGSIKMDPSDKRHLVAGVGSIQPFMRQQALGGERIHRGDLQYIPKRARPTPSAVTRPSKFPARIIAKGGAVFPLRYPSTPGVWKIKGGKKRKNQRLELMYSVQRKAIMITPVWNFLRKIERTVDQKWGQRLIEAFEIALKTAKKKHGSGKRRR